MFATTLALGLWAWSHSKAPLRLTLQQQPMRQHDMFYPWRFARFRQLIAVFLLSGMASAGPATLVLFFVQDRLQAPALAPLFLASYFVAAAASMPVWMRGVARWGLVRCWLAGMLLSVVVFALAARLSAGDVIGFAAVCVLSGLALGAELTMPNAMLAGLVKQHGDRNQREGSYFGWWNMVAKLNLALAAGLALPLLDLLGYQPGTTLPSGLLALTWAYAVLPCVLKLMAAAVLYLSFLRRSPSNPAHFSEASWP